MDWRLFFKRNLKFGKKLVRIHHTNAILFTLLSISGLLLISSFFRLQFPTTRVWIKDIHVWIGLLSILPILFYLPKMAKHLTTLRKRKNHRINLFLVLCILFALIISGLILSFQPHFPPIISSYALFIHDLMTWIGLPYILFHSITRSSWFKNLTNPKRELVQESEPKEIERYNPLLKRRSFLQFLVAGILTLATLPYFGKWIRAYLPGLTNYDVTDGNKMNPIPEPTHPMLTDGRNGEFRYYTITEVPRLTDENWSFAIDGLVDNKLTYNWNEFIKLKRDSQLSDFHCITGWSVYNITWEGIPLKRLLELAGVQKSAKFVKLYSADGVYTDSLTLSEAMMEDTMVAMFIDGQLITQQNGGPVRLVSPKLYGYKSVKWLNRVELIEEEHFGYWEERGYDQNAWVRMY